MSEDAAIADLSDDEQPPVKCRAYWNDKMSRFYHENMAMDLIDLRCARFIENLPAIWDSLEGRYRIGYGAWDAAIVDLTISTTTNHRKEVANYLHIVAEKYDQGDTHLIACANGVVNPWVDGYDVLDDEGHSPGFIPNSPELNIPNVLPVSWDPSAYDAATDEALDAFACGDPDVRMTLEEIAAASIFRGRELQNMAVVVGPGGNGKSVFMQMLQRLLGRENYSTIDLRDIGKRFMQAPIVGRLCNIGDDIADGIIEAAPLSVVKKIVTGDPITVEEKFRSAVTVRPYASLVFAANQFPRLADYSTGMLDRIFGVPFSADFRHDSARRVTNISELLDTDASRQYLLNLALKRLPGLVSRGGYTSTPYSESMRAAVLHDNDSVSYWLDSEGIKPSHVADRPVSEVYSQYRVFCESAGRRPVEQRTFTTRLNKHLHTYTAKDVYLGSRQVRGFHVRGV